ncbi:unnamed protein product [Cunninghamella blakesleeana]
MYQLKCKEIPDDNVTNVNKKQKTKTRKSVQFVLTATVYIQTDLENASRYETEEILLANGYEEKEVEQRVEQGVEKQALEVTMNASWKRSFSEVEMNEDEDNYIFKRNKTKDYKEENKSLLLLLTINEYQKSSSLLSVTTKDQESFSTLSAAKDQESSSSLTTKDQESSLSLTTKKRSRIIFIISCSKNNIE